MDWVCNYNFTCTNTRSGLWENIIGSLPCGLLIWNGWIQCSWEVEGWVQRVLVKWRSRWAFFLFCFPSLCTVGMWKSVFCASKRFTKLFSRYCRVAWEVSCCGLLFWSLRFWVVIVMACFVAKVKATFIQFLLDSLD